MLRKEILGTKVRTESGLNKPLTLVRPNNNEDYKNLEFLDTDILLAKDIKRFVKGGGVDGDGLNLLYTYSTFILEDETFIYLNNEISTQYKNKYGFSDEPDYNGLKVSSNISYVKDSKESSIFTNILIGNDTFNGTYGISDITDQIYSDPGCLRGPFYGGKIPYWLWFTYNKEYLESSGLKYIEDVCGPFTRNLSPMLFSEFYGDDTLYAGSSTTGEIFRFLCDDALADIECIPFYASSSKLVHSYIDRSFATNLYKAKVVTYDHDGTNMYHNVRGIKSIPSEQSPYKVFATDGSVATLPLNTPKPIFSYIQVTYLDEEDSFTEGRVVNLGVYLQTLDSSYIKIGAHEYISLSSTSGYTVSHCQHTIWPFYEQQIGYAGNLRKGEYSIRNTVGIHSDNGYIGYYCSDGTITTIDQLREKIGSDVQINNTSSITLSQEGKSSTMDLAYSGITLNQYLTSSANPGLCRGRIAGGALDLARAYTNASGVTDLSDPDYKISLNTANASIRGYSKDGHGYVLTRRNQTVTIDGNDVTFNVPLLYLTGDNDNRLLATADSLLVGNFKNAENTNNVQLVVFDGDYSLNLRRTGVCIKGYGINNTFPTKAGLFIDTVQSSYVKTGVFMGGKDEFDLLTADGGTKRIGVAIADQLSIKNLQSQIEELTARIAALEAK